MFPTPSNPMSLRDNGAPGVQLRRRGCCGVGEQFELDDESVDCGGVVFVRGGLQEHSVDGTGEGPEQEMGFGVVDFQFDLR